MPTSEIATLQGEMIIGNVVHGAMVNVMIVPYDDPSAWFFQQFPSQEAVETYALEHNLVMKRKE